MGWMIVGGSLRRERLKEGESERTGKEGGKSGANL